MGFDGCTVCSHGYSVTDLKVAILEQLNFKGQLECDAAELDWELIFRFDTIRLELSKNWE